MPAAEIANYISTVLDKAGGVLQSSLVIAFVGGLTGAIGGALGAQHIAERTKRRDEILNELRSTNAAIMVTFTICNAGLALKRQHVQPMYDEFAKQKDALHTFNSQRGTGQLQTNAEHRFVADMRTFPALIVPIETLKGLVFEKMSAFGRPLALVSVLDQSLVGLREAIVRRDALVHRFASGAIPADQIPQYYFGMPLPSGDMNQEYPDLVEAISSYVDDIVFFSALLCADLVKHGNQVHAEFNKRFRKGAPRVSTADFRGPREKGLIPSDNQYADWLNAFTQHEAESSDKAASGQ